MIDLFRGLKNLLKVSRLHIDGSVFRLHYNATVLVLIAFSLLVTTRQYVGNPIECISSKDVSESVINTFCWIHSTYTVPRTNSNPDVPYPGLDSSRGIPYKDRRYHKYYQWVAFILFFQAALFYLPRWLWKQWEGGKIQSLAADLVIGTGSRSDPDAKQRRRVLLEYLWESRGQHNWWAVRYILCELLSLGNVIGQLFLMDRFFDGEFFTYGIRVIKFSELDPESRTDPMILLFPRVTKCQFKKFGSSGEVETLDSICILPLNVANEKIYIFLWFWMFILAGLTALVIAFRILIFASAWLRVYLLYARLRFVEREKLNSVVAISTFGDWFLIYMLTQNIDPLIFKEVIVDYAKLATELRKDPPS